MPVSVATEAGGLYRPIGLEQGAGSRPNLVAWRNRVTSREAFKRAEEKGGPAIPKS